jgi:hypothetical protein
MGLRAQWSAPPETAALTGYRVWTAEGFDESLPASQTDTLVDLSTAGVDTTVNVAAVYGPDESTPATATGKAARPGGLVGVWSAPTAVLDSARGIGTAKGTVAARAVKRVKVTGRAGVPATGVRSVILVLRISGATRTTSLSAGPAAGPRSAVVTVAKAQPRVRTTVVPVASDGRVEVRHSAGRAHLRVDVAGYTSQPDASAPGAGRVTAVPPTALASSRSVSGGSTLAVTTLGRGAVPADGVAAVWLRVRAKAGRGTASLGVGPDASSARVAALMTSPATRDSVLVLARPGSDGKVRVRNLGGTPATVSVEAVGWVSAPSVDVGRWVVERAGAVVADTVTGYGLARGAVPGRGTRTVQISGRANVPTALDETPAEAVLLRISGDATTTAAMSLSVRSGPDPYGLPVVEATGGRAASAVLAVPLTDAGTMMLRNDQAGAANVRVEVVGWLVDRPTLTANGRVLSEAEAAKYAPVEDDYLTVTGPARAPQAGEVLGAGPTTTNPYGFLRRVLEVTDQGNGTYRMRTEPADIADVVRNAAGSVVHPVGAPVETLTEPGPGVTDTPAAPRLRRPDRATASAEVIDEDIGIKKSFKHTETRTDTEGNSVSLTLEGSASVEAEADVDIGVGWRGVEAEVSASADEALTASAKVTGAMSDQLHFQLGRYRFRPFVVQVGPLPVVITPVIEATVRGAYSAQVEATATFTQSSRAKAGARYRHGEFSTIREFEDKKPTVTPSIEKVHFGGEVELRAGVELEFYGTAGAVGVGLAAGVRTNYTWPNCFINSDAYLDATASVAVAVPLADDLAWADNFRLAEWDLPDLRVPGALGCPWTGVIEISSGWQGEGRYRPPNELDWMDSARSGSTSVALRRVVPDGDLNGYWVNTGTISGSTFPGCFNPTAETKTVTATLNPGQPPPPEERDQWRLSTDSPPLDYDGTGTSSNCGEVTTHPVTLQIDTGAYLAINDAWGKRNTSDDFVEERFDYSFGGGCILHQGVEHWCHGASYADEGFAHYNQGGAVTISIRMTRLRDVNSDGIPD